MATDVIELLRRANPVPGDPPAPAIEGLLGRLGDGPGPPVGRRVGGAVGAGLAVALAVLVAVVMVVALGHRGAIRTAGVPAAARPLVAELAVLRRPQTAADRSGPAAFERPGVVRSLTRLARRVGDVRVFVIVRVAGSPQVAVVSAVAVGTGWRRSLIDGATATSLRRPRPPLLAPPRGPLFGAIVPDRVRVVQWVFPGLGIHSVARGNVVIGGTAHVRGELDRVTWLGEHHVIAVLNAAAERARRADSGRRAIATSSRRPVAPSLLEHFQLLREPQSAVPGPALALPTDSAVRLAKQPGGLNLARARFVAVGGTEPPLDGYPDGVWVIPGRTRLCWQDTGFNAECAVTLTGHGSPDSAGMVGSTQSKATQWLTGVEPDGNDTISIVLADGSITKVRVVHNVFSVAVRIAPHGRAVAVLAKDASGRRVRLDL